ncbi:hypothetical protein AB1Y20_015847 [Prymnesium parvum]|uniref:Reverse transcriptase domain-containing protein n=1 Tax=Prymnesium parvum TaxID=97485 RepID=A0AB34K1D6_PRYPA
MGKFKQESSSTDSDDDTDGCLVGRPRDEPRPFGCPSASVARGDEACAPCPVVRTAPRCAVCSVGARPAPAAGLSGAPASPSAPAPRPPRAPLRASACASDRPLPPASCVLHCAFHPSLFLATLPPLRSSPPLLTLAGAGLALRGVLAGKPKTPWFYALFVAPGYGAIFSSFHNLELQHLRAGGNYRKFRAPADATVFALTGYIPAAVPHGVLPSPLPVLPLDAPPSLHHHIPPFAPLPVLAPPPQQGFPYHHFRPASPRHHPYLRHAPPRHEAGLDRSSSPSPLLHPAHDPDLFACRAQAAADSAAAASADVATIATLDAHFRAATASAIRGATPAATSAAHTISREAAADALRDCPVTADLLPAYRLKYGRLRSLRYRRQPFTADGAAVHSCLGPQQGCTWGTLVCALVHQRALTLATLRHPGTTVLGFADDAHVHHLVPEHAFSSLLLLRQVLQERAGVAHNDKGGCIAAPGFDISFSPASFPGSPNHVDGPNRAYSALGGFVGPPDVVSDALHARVLTLDRDIDSCRFLVDSPRCRYALQARLRLIRDCACHAVTHLTRAHAPAVSREAATLHDKLIRHAVFHGLAPPPDSPPSAVQRAVTLLHLPTRLGGHGFTSALATAPAAFLASALEAFAALRVLLPHFGGTDLATDRRPSFVAIRAAHADVLQALSSVESGYAALDSSACYVDAFGEPHPPFHPVGLPSFATLPPDPDEDNDPLIGGSPGPLRRRSRRCPLATPPLHPTPRRVFGPPLDTL